VASILHDELTRAGTKALITGNEKESVDVALAELDRNELLVVFLDEDPTAPETLASIGARPVGSILRTQATATRT